MELVIISAVILFGLIILVKFISRCPCECCDHKVCECNCCSHNKNKECKCDCCGHFICNCNCCEHA